MNLEIVEHGVMLPDYFQGTGGVQINIYIDNKTTLSDVVDLIEDEINITWDNVEYTAEYHGHILVEQDIERLLDGLRKDITGKENSIYFEGELDEDSTAIFSIEFGA